MSIDHHVNVKSGECSPWPGNPERARVPLVGWRNNPAPLSISRDEWQEIGRRMGWLPGSALVRRRFEVYYGDNGDQEFWESAGKAPVFALIRNKQAGPVGTSPIQEASWFAMLDGSLVYDAEATADLQKTIPSAVVTLGCATVEGLAAKLLAREGVAVDFCRGQVWVKSGERKMRLVPVEGAK